MTDEQDRLVGWTIEEHLAFYIRYALPRVLIRGRGRGFPQEDRRLVARSIVEHLRLCGWEFRMGKPAVGRRGG
jgi:hypothetical protein